MSDTGALYALSFANHGVWRYHGGNDWTNVRPANDVASMAVDAAGELFVLSFANHGVLRLDGGWSGEITTCEFWESWC